MHSDLVLFGRNTIRKEAEALTKFVDRLDETFAEVCELLHQCQGTVLVTGMGKSGLVARKWVATFAGTGTRAYYLNPAEAPHGDLGIVSDKDVIILLSFSGETEELDHIVRHASLRKVPTVAVTGNPRSSLAEQCKLVLSVDGFEEACPLGLAPTTSSTLMMALGDALATSLMQMRGFTEKDFAQLHPGGSLGRRLWLGVEELMHVGEKIPQVSLEEPIERVLVEMTRKCLGIAVVLEGDKICGVITDGDLRRYFQKRPLQSHARASEIMTANPKRIPSTALAVEARELMENHKIQQLLIVDAHERLKGVVHLYDLMRAKVF